MLTGILLVKMGLTHIIATISVVVLLGGGERWAGKQHKRRRQQNQELLAVHDDLLPKNPLCGSPGRGAPTSAWPLNGRERRPIERK
jgi:hypothetical protein